jgi:hypothetical protein
LAGIEAVRERDRGNSGENLLWEAEMIIKVQIHAVDGETYNELTCRNASQALKYLEQHDHEGAEVYVGVTAEHDDAYAILKGVSAIGDTK